MHTREAWSQSNEPNTRNEIQQRKPALVPAPSWASLSPILPSAQKHCPPCLLPPSHIPAPSPLNTYLVSSSIRGSCSSTVSLPLPLTHWVVQRFATPTASPVVAIPMIGLNGLALLVRRMLCRGIFAVLRGETGAVGIGCGKVQRGKTSNLLLGPPSFLCVGYAPKWSYSRRCAVHSEGRWQLDDIIPTPVCTEP